MNPNENENCNCPFGCTLHGRKVTLFQAVLLELKCEHRRREIEREYKEIEREYKDDLRKVEADLEIAKQALKAAEEDEAQVAKALACMEEIGNIAERIREFAEWGALTAARYADGPFEESPDLAESDTE